LFNNFMHAHTHYIFHRPLSTQGFHNHFIRIQFTTRYFLGGSLFTLTHIFIFLPTAITHHVFLLHLLMICILLVMLQMGQPFFYNYRQKFITLRLSTQLVKCVI
jgi:hypothetical protein